MKNRIARIAAVAAFLVGAFRTGAAQQNEANAPQQLKVNIDIQQAAKPVSPYEYGMFIEHIGALIYRSLWSEMLDDRKFYFPIRAEEPQAAAPAQGGPFRNMQLRKWHPIGPANSVVMDKQHPFVGEQSPRIELDASTPHGIRQSGFALVKGKKYIGHIWVRATPGAKLKIAPAWGEGANERQSIALPPVAGTYKELPFTFTAVADTGAGTLEITGTGVGDFHIGAVSLMPAENLDGFRPGNDALSKECLDTAIKLWNDEKTHPAPNPFRGGFARFGPPEWSAALELMIATNGAEPYKQRVQELFPTMLEHLDTRGWSAVRALPYLDAGSREKFKAALQAWLPKLNRELDQTPFGVPASRRDWGGSEQVADFGAEMYFLHQAFPDIVGPEYTLRAANYLLGTHPVSSESYIAAIGTVSRQHTYSTNRGDYSYIPGAMIPGYVVIKPDFPECMSDFGMLWFEHETTVSAASSWVLEANAAAAIVSEKSAASRHSGN